jgi:hypothetical protein
VIEKKAGRQRICELNASPLRDVNNWLNRYEQFWGTNLQSLKKYVESRGKSGGLTHALNKGVIK